MTTPDTTLATATDPEMEFILKHPFISASGQRIEKLVFRRGKRADMKAAARFSSNDAEQESFLFARLTGSTIEDIDAIDLADMQALTAFFRDKILGIGQVTVPA